MNKRILLEPGGFPVYTRDLIALQDNMLATVTQLAKMVAGPGALTGCMLWGDLTKEGDTWKVTDGAIYLNNDIYPVEAGSITPMEGEIAYLAVKVSQSDVRVYKDGNEHPSEASYKVILTAFFQDSIAFIPCTQVTKYQTRLRDIVDQVGHKYETVAVQGTNTTTIESNGLLVRESVRGDHRDVHLQGQIIIRSSSDGEIATFIRQGLRGNIPGCLYSVSSQSYRQVTVIIAETYPDYRESTIYLYEADGTRITSLIGGAFGFTLFINGYISLT